MMNVTQSPKLFARPRNRRANQEIFNGEIPFNFILLFWVYPRERRTIVFLKVTHRLCGVEIIKMSLSSWQGENFLTKPCIHHRLEICAKVILCLRLHPDFSMIVISKDLTSSWTSLQLCWRDSIAIFCSWRTHMLLSIVQYFFGLITIKLKRRITKCL